MSNYKVRSIRRMYGALVMSEQAQKNNRSKVLGGVLSVLVLVAIAVWMMNSKQGRPKPETTSGAVYYTGPMAQKGNPNMIADENGRIYPPPAGGAAPAKPAAGLKAGGGGASSR